MSPAAGGSVSVSGSAVANGASASLGYGVSTSLAATPASGYSFSGWTVTTGVANATIGSAARASTTITPFTGAATVQATSSLQSEALTVSLNPAAGGSMRVGGSAVPNGGSTSLGYGVSTTLAATPTSGYSFTGWTITTGVANASDSLGARPAPRRRSPSLGRPRYKRPSACRARP